MRERLPTDITAKWPLFHVHTSVSCETIEPSKRLAALITVVWPLSRVHKSVSCETIEPSKRLAALITSVWPLSRVSETMASHSILIMCGILAPLALVLAVLAGGAEVLFDVFIPMILFHTRGVALDRADRGATCRTP